MIPNLEHRAGKLNREDPGRRWFVIHRVWRWIMATAYSGDLRERIYGEIVAGGSRRAAARRFGVSASTRPGSVRRRRGHRFRLSLLEPELQLIRFAGHLLRRAAERHAAKPGHLHPQLLQLGAGSDEDGLQEVDIVGQRGGIGRHACLYQNSPADTRESLRKARLLTRPASVEMTESGAVSPRFPAASPASPA